MTTVVLPVTMLHRFSQFGCTNTVDYKVHLNNHDMLFNLSQAVTQPLTRPGPRAKLNNTSFKATCAHASHGDQLCVVVRNYFKHR